MSQIQVTGQTNTAKAALLGRLIAFLYGDCILRRILRHLPLRHRLRRRSRGAEDDRQPGRSRRGRRRSSSICCCMSVFAIQHSVMARKQFKRWWTQFVPASVERSTYVLLASLALALLLWQWRPMPAVVWQIADPAHRHGGDGPVVRRLVHRADQHVPDQPFRAVRAAPGRQQSRAAGRCRRRGFARRCFTNSCAIRSISASSSRSGRRRR